MKSYTNEDNDFKAIISKISDLNADIIYIPDYYNVAGLIAKQLGEAGVDATLVGVDGWDGIQADYGADAEGGFSPTTTQLRMNQKWFKALLLLMKKNMMKFQTLLRP